VINYNQIERLRPARQVGAHPSDPAQTYGVFEMEMTDWELDQAIQIAAKMADARDSTRRPFVAGAALGRIGK
jgi:hypothetical protein